MTTRAEPGAMIVIPALPHGVNSASSSSRRSTTAEIFPGGSTCEPHAVAIQFRYAFVADADGLAVVDVTDPPQARALAEARVPLPDARDVYVARTYAYVAGGAQGLVIIDVERPEHPFVDQVYTAGGVINDARAVKVGMTNASLLAYVADGRNGLRVIQLTSDATPGYQGFSPRPRPDLPGHTRELEAHRILRFDLVAVNLYPFQTTISRPSARPACRSPRWIR